MTEQHPVNIRCPYCSNDNAINLSKNIKCKHCNKSLVNERYIKPIISGAATFIIAAIIGASSGVAIDEYFETDRYPIPVEYSIIDNCISAYNVPLRIENFKAKKYVCECALGNTEKKISYEEYEKNKTAFLDEFEKQAYGIVKEIREKYGREAVSLPL